MSRKTHEDSLLKSKVSREKYLEYIISLMPGSAYWKDRDGRHLGCNKEMAVLFGFRDPSEIVGKTAHDFLAKKIADRVEEVDRLVISTGKALTVEEVGIDKNGKKAIYLSQKQPIFSDAGEVVGLIGTSIDISRRKHIEEQILSFLPASVYWKNEQGKYLGCNKEMANLFGFSNPEKVIGKIVSDFLDKESAERIEQADSNVMREKKGITLEERVLDKSDNELTYLSKKEPIFDESGEVIGLIGISLDITERKQMEAALRVTKEKAEIANVVKSEFISSMSHEFRTPLNAVMGLTQLLLMEPQPEKTKNSLQEIMRAGSHLLGLVTDILDFSRLEAEKLELAQEPFSLKKCFSETLRNFDHLLEQHPKIQFHSEFSNDLPEYVVGDAKCLRQILFNLVGNAIKFTHKGRITVRAHLVKQDKKRVTLKIEVQDTGVGIPKDKLDLIFERFTQADGSYTRHYGGTGLGLAITKKLLDRAGGSIEVHSELKKGSCFAFNITYDLANAQEIKAAQEQEKMPWKPEVLPGSEGRHTSIHYDSVGSAAITDEEEEEPATTSSVVFSHSPDASKDLLKNKHVVIIEDEKINQMVLKMLLEQLGGTPVIFDNAIPALKHLEEATEPAALILTDIGLPDMNGVEFMQKLRQDKRYQNTPVFAVTGFSAKPEIQRFLDAGADEVLNKPVSGEMLERYIEKHLQITKEPVVSNNEFYSDPEIFDYAKTLEQRNGNQALVKELLSILKEELPEYKKIFQTCVKTKDGEQLSATAHKLRGGVSMLSMPKLKEAAGLVEKSAKKLGVTSHVTIFVDELLDEIAAVEKALNN